MLSCLFFVVLACVAQIGAFTPGRWFDRVFVFQMENTAFGTTMANPEFSSFAQRGKLFTNFFAAYHPSQPNYWAHSGATNFGQPTNSPVDLNETHLADLLEAKGISWKTYQENYPGSSTYCATLEYSADYKYCRKHNPYMSYININRNLTRCARIVNSAELDTDLDRGTLPQYSFFTPNLDNDAHDTDITFGGNYLRRFFLTEGRLNKFPPRTLIVITFDEDHYDGPNLIYTLFVGDMIAAAGEVNTRDATRYTVFSLTRTIEDNWDLGTLGRNDLTAVPMFSLSQTQAPTATSSPPVPPTGAPTPQPTTAAPTLEPTSQPTSQPVAPTDAPTGLPTPQPTEPAPTDAPTVPPPTDAPTSQPTAATPEPTAQVQTPAPTDEPVTGAPTSGTDAPTAAVVPTEPAGPTSAPTKELTVQPTVVAPTGAPTEELSKMRAIFEAYKLFFVIGGGLLMLIFLGLIIAFAVVKIVQAVKDRRIQVEAAQFFDKDYEMTDTHGDNNVDLDNELSSDHSSDDTF